MSRTIVNPGDLISDAVIVDNLVFTSGITGRPGNTETQIRNTFKRLQDILEKSGTSMDNVIKATIYLSDLSDGPKYLNGIWKEMFPENPPARTCIQAGLREETKIEIEMVAIIPDN